MNLSFRVDGPLIELPINVGDKVKEGQLLARIDPRDFEVDLRNAQATLERSKAALTFATNDYGRALRIQKEDPGAISESLVDRKREDQNRLSAEVRSKTAQVDAASDKLEYSTLEAPFKGIIVAKYIDNFEFVTSKQPVIRMLDTSRIEMVVDIPEHLIMHVPSVKRITVEFDTFPGRTFSAKIKEIGTEASVTTRTYPVTLIMQQPDDIEIFSGMSGEATFVGKIQVGVTEELMTIPVSAIFADKESDRSFVWVIDENTHLVSRKEVTLQKLTNYGVRVSEGLKPGDWIAIAGVHYLKEGQKVSIFDSSHESIETTIKDEN